MTAVVDKTQKGPSIEILDVGKVAFVFPRAFPSTEKRRDALRQSADVSERWKIVENVPSFIFKCVNLG